VERRRLIGLFSRRALQTLLHFEEAVFAQSESHPHRIAGVQRIEQRLLRRDERAGPYQ